MKKFFKLLLVAVLSLSMLCSTACMGGGATGSDDPHVLDIYLLYKGYQDEWLTANIETFKQQSWVKEKYPDLKINYTYDGVDATASSKISSGGAINKYDLIFSVNMHGYDGTGLTADLTDLVYLQKIPGEGDTRVIDKISQERLDCFDATGQNGVVQRADGYGTYYTLSYIEGMFGMLYNQDILTAMDEQIPVTTEEFYTLLAKIDSTGYTLPNKSKNNVGMISSQSGYCQTMFNVWWGQYEGYDDYVNYFNAIDAVGNVTNEVVGDIGRLRSLEVMDELFYNYDYELSGEVEAREAQARFLDGNGAFHYNGDYFASEMRNTINTLKNEGIDYDIKYMKMPVISSIVERLSIYKTAEGTVEFDHDDVSTTPVMVISKPYSELDETKQAHYDAILASTVREIDNGVEYNNSVAKSTYNLTSSDWNIIKEARGISGFTTGDTQTIAIPSYSPAKELAADFMIYMYSDVALKTGAKASNGIRFCAEYDYENDAETYATFSRISKSSYEIMNDDYINLPMEESFPFGKVGFTALASVSGRLEVMFASHASTRDTAIKIYRQEIKNWTKNKFDQVISQAP